MEEGKKSRRRVEEGKMNGRRKERRVEEGNKKRKKSERRKEKRTEKKVEYGRCLLIFLVIQESGEGQRVEEPWNLGAGVSKAQVQASLIL